MLIHCMENHVIHVLRYRKDNNREIIYITNWKKNYNNQFRSANPISSIIVQQGQGKIIRIPIKTVANHANIRKHLKGDEE